MDYSIPVFTGTHDKEMSKKKVPLTMKYVDDESNLRKSDDAYSMKEAGGVYPDSLGPEQDDEFINDVNPSTDRVRRYYKRHPEKVKQYLRSTVDDRVARNRDRRKAVQKHGKKKMKNHDVHHPEGPHGGSWKLAKKDHGPDKKKAKKEPTKPSEKKPEKKPATDKKRAPSKLTPKKSAPKKAAKSAISRDLTTQLQLFTRYAISRLKIKNAPTITIIPPTDDMTSLGKYNPSLNKIFVVVQNRLLADILRTLAHELVHHKQQEMGQLTNPSVDGATGSPIENYAHVVAGILMRDYGKTNTQIFLKEEVVTDEVLEPEDVEIEEQEADLYQIVQDMEFKDTTKKPIAYSKHANIESEEHLETMPPFTYAVNGIPSMKVDTLTTSGKETTNVAYQNDIVVCGPSKEKYVLSPEKFEEYYTPVEKGPEGMVIPNQKPRKVAQYTGQVEVSFVAPWGEEMVLTPEDYLVKDGKNDFYRIGKLEYETTYNPPGTVVAKLELPAQERPLAILPGKFQPFESSHYVSYLQLVKEFGKDRTYIVTSNKQDAAGKSPFTFDQKKKIMTKMFGMPEENIIETKNPYKPIELVQEFPENTPVVFAVSEQDSSRLGVSYFKPYVREEYKSGYRKNGYVWAKPTIENKKLLSGGQIRHIFGNPKFSDRVKQEIFSKLYGSFDSEIYEMIQKVSEKAELDRALTMQYKREKENPVPDQVITENTAVIDPKKDAPSDKPKSAKLKVYKKVKPIDVDYLKRAMEEYFENEKTFKAFPKLAKNKKEFVELLKSASSKVLTADELLNLKNSDVGQVLASKTPTSIIKDLSKTDPKKFRDVLAAIKANEKLPMPIVISHEDGYYLLDGNTRLTAMAALRTTMPVLILQHEGPSAVPVEPPSNKKKPSLDLPAEDKEKTKEALNKVLQMKITNPETGNLIKIDTAMDYNKNHPAHILALNMIRHYMRDISSRAGIPKKLQYAK